MYSLYEHVHYDWDLIQGSAGATDDFSWLRKAGEEEIATFDGHRIATDMSRRSRSMNRTLDPIEHLPPELSTFVIAEALPPLKYNSLRSTYSSRLIELTTVSKKWQSFLFSTPVLWSELVIDERQEDFLATLSVFVRLSSDAPLTLFLYGKPTGIDWTGPTSVLLPAVERVTRLQFGLLDEADSKWVPNAVSNLLVRLRHLPRLEEVEYITDDWEGFGLLLIKSLGLPSSIGFSGLFRIEMPESCWESGTHSRFFDITKCTRLSTLGQLRPPSRPNLLLLEYRTYFDQSNMISNGTTLSQLESFAESLAQCNCFEQVVHMATFPLHRLQVDVDLSQTKDLLDCLRTLMHIQYLELYIEWSDRKITRDHTLSNTTRPDLKSLLLNLDNKMEGLVDAQKPLADLLSALGILYPGVEEVYLRGSACMGPETAYLQSLRALKSLILQSQYPPLALPSGPITLQSVQHLEMRGLALLDNMYAPNLLKLVLELSHDVTKLDHLGPFPQGLRSLAIKLKGEMKDVNLTSLNCPDLQDLHLTSSTRRASWGRPQLSNLVSIKVESKSPTFTDPSSNQLCITLLRYPWRLPSLRQLHFNRCVEWDVLFLMLKRRNCDKSGVQRIDTVTLPFIPFAFHKLLARLLAGEIIELPSVISLSLEATREVIFDSSVPGCFACMRHMRPGCTAEVVLSQIAMSADTLYPYEDPVLEETPREIRDWLSQRWELVKMWKASYDEFSLKFSRESVCVAFPHVPL